MTWNMNLLFYHSTKKLNPKNEAPIYCRITIEGKRAEFSTGIYCSCEEWSSIKRGKISAKKAYLDQIRTNLNSLYLSEAMERSGVSSSSLLQKYRQPKDLSISDLAKKFVANEKSDVDPATQKKYQGYLNNLDLFAGPHSCKSLSDIWPGFQRWLSKKSGVCHQKRHYQFIRSVIDYGRQMGLNIDPLPPIKWPKRSPNEINHLTVTELEAVRSLKLAQERLRKIRDVFILQCETGLSFADLIEFRPNKHLEERKGVSLINMKRTKTSLQLIVPLDPDTVMKLRQFPEGLPVPSNQKYNSYIKEIAMLADIDKRITTHTARRTFAMLQLNSGYSIEAVSRMLGHATTRTTFAHYARVKDDRVIEEFLKLAG